MILTKNIIDIPGYEGRYAISENSQVWSYPNKTNNPKGRWLKQYIDRDGYAHVGLYKDSKSIKTWSVHRLVAKTYIPNEERLPLINHLDSDPSNNSVSNLEWCTALRNNHHMIAAGRARAPKTRLQLGEDNPRAILNWKAVRDIRELYAQKSLNQYQLAKKYGVCQSTIWHITSRLTWKTV